MKLRQSIRTWARSESTLLDVGAAAEIQREIQNKVMGAVRTSAKLLEEQSGIKPSLTDRVAKSCRDGSGMPLFQSDTSISLTLGSLWW